MTDLEDFAALMERFGLPVKRETHQERPALGEPWPPLDHVISFSNTYEDDHPKIGGYIGFGATFIFDHELRFKMVTFWE